MKRSEFLSQRLTELNAYLPAVRKECALLRSHGNWWSLVSAEENHCSAVKETVRLKEAISEARRVEAEEEAKALRDRTLRAHTVDSVGYHGLLAYRGKEADLLRNAEYISSNPSAEICISDKPIGTVGLLLSGPTVWFESDVYSEIGENGHRTARCGISEKLAQLDDEGLPVHDSSYAEGWCRPATILGVWFTNEEGKALAAGLGEALSVPYIGAKESLAQTLLILFMERNAPQSFCNLLPL